MDDSEHGVGGLALLEQPTRDAVTMEIPNWLGDEETIPLVEPRRYGPDGPVWDSTDEIYITYNEDGERDVVTTGDGDIWNREHSYQRTGSGRYGALRDIGGRVGGVVRDGWASAATAIQGWPQVRVDRDRDGTGRGPDGGARPGSEDHGARHARPRRDSWRQAERSRVPERSHGGDLHGTARSHRHCPGCSGHEFARRSWWGVFSRGVLGWFIGWLGLVLGGVDISLGRYFILTALGFCAVFIARPVWREFVGSEDRHTRGGRR